MREAVRWAVLLKTAATCTECTVHGRVAGISSATATCSSHHVDADITSHVLLWMPEVAFAACYAFFLILPQRLVIWMAAVGWLWSIPTHSCCLWGCLKAVTSSEGQTGLVEVIRSIQCGLICFFCFPVSHRVNQLQLPSPATNEGADPWAFPVMKGWNLSETMSPNQHFLCHVVSIGYLLKAMQLS